MTQNQEISEQLELLLGLKTPPIGLIFSETPLSGVPKIEAASPSSCAYWKLAVEGRLFYTTAADHLGCPIGAHTHGVELAAADEKNLMAIAGMMTGMGYLTDREVSLIPRRPAKLEVVTYGPLARLPREPDVVLLRSAPRAAMLLAEAEQAANVRSEGATAIRPACAMIPDVLRTRRATTSLGCIGNRVYTELPDDEVWSSLPGHVLPGVLEQLRIVSQANRELESFHRARL